MNFVSRTKKDFYNFFDVQFHNETAQAKPNEAISTQSVREISAPAPTTTLKKSTSGGFFFELLATIRRLISTFFPKPPSPNALDHRLFEDLLLSSSGRKLRGKNAFCVLHYVTEFLSRERGIPAHILQELKEACRIQESLEKIDTLAPPEKKRARQGLAESMSNSIKALQDGQSLLISGGTSNAHALYRITKDGNTFKLQILSRDPAIQENEVISSSGKSKILSGTQFHSVTQEELCDVVWLQALLSLQQNGTKSALVELLKHLNGRKVDPANDANKIYHKAQSGLSRVQNIWSYVHDQIGSTKEHRDRRKLRFWLDALFRYADTAKENIKTSPFAKDYILEGCRRVSQKAMSLYRKGALSQEELSWIKTELFHMQQHLAESTEQVSNISNKHATTLSVTSTLQARTEPQNYRELPEVKHESVQKKVAKAKVSPNEKFAAPKASLSNFSGNNLFASLQQVQQELKTKSGSLDPLTLQHWLVDVIFEIPLEMINEDIVARERFNPNDPWKKLSSQERIEASSILASLAKKLSQLSQLTQTKLPDRAICLLKLCYLAEHLAFCNSDITHFGKNHYVDKSHRVLESMLRGELVTHSMYRSKERREYDTLKKLDEYYLRKLCQCDRRGVYNEIIHDDFFKVNKARESAQIKDLRDCLTALSQAIDYTKDKWNTAGKIDEWGRPIEDKGLAAAAFTVEVRRGIDPYFHNGNGKESTWSTQEAIVDSPTRVLNYAVKEWMGHLEKIGDSKALKKKANCDLKVDELRDVLLTLDEHTAVWNIMGVIEERPELLSNPDICSIFEMLFLRQSNIQWTLMKDENFASFLAEFMKKHIANFRKKDEIEPALFLIHLLHSFTASIQDSKEYRRDKVLKHLPSFDQEVYAWTLESLRDDSKIKKYAHSLLTEYLFLFNKKKKLTARELCNLVIFYFFLENKPIDPAHYDPVTIDQVRKNVNTWQPVLTSLFERDESLKIETIERLASLAGAEVERGAWSGSYPIYKQPKFTIDLSKGLLQKNDAAISNEHLPANILRLDAFKEAFPEYVKDQPHVKRGIIDNGFVYIFSDMQGKEVRIEEQNHAVTIFRRHPTRDIWTRFVPKEQLKVQANSAPAAIVSLPCFASCDNPQEIFAYKVDGKCLFRLTPQGVDDLRPEYSHRTTMIVSGLDAKMHPELAFLERFAGSEQILLWGKKGSLQEVELMQYGLTFKLERGRLISTTEPIKEYTINIKESQSSSRGLVRALALDPPTSEKPAKTLLAHYEGSYQVIQPQTQPRNYVMDLLSAWWRKYFPEFTDPEERTSVQFVGEHKGFRLYDRQADGKLVPSAGENRERALFDLVNFSLASLSVNNYACLQTIEEALFEIEKLTPSHFTESFVLSVIPELHNLVSHAQARRVEVSGEVVGYVLRLFLELKRKSPDSLQAELERRIANLAPTYFSLGKHREASSLLSQTEIMSVLAILKKQNPEYYADNALQLAGDDQEIVSKAQIKPKRFIELNKEFLNRLSDVEFTFLGGVKNASKSVLSDLVLNRNSQEFTSSFASLYDFVRTAQPQEELFKNLHTTLKSIKSSANDVIGSSVNFFTALFDLKLDNPAIKFPERPQLEYPVIDRFKAHQAEDAKHKENDEKFSQFFNSLADVVKKHYPKIYEQFDEKTPSQELDERTLQQKLDEVAKHIKEDEIPLESLTAEKLEELLASKQKEPLDASLYEPNLSERLFAASSFDSEINPSIESTPIDESIFQALEKDEEPAVASAAKSWKLEIKKYNKQVQDGLILRRSFKEEASVSRILAKVDAKKKEIDEALTLQKTKILGYIQPSGTTIVEIERAAGYQRLVTWDELYLLCLQGDIAKLKTKLGANIDIDELQAELRKFFKLEVNSKFIAKARTELETIRKEKLYNSPSSVEKALDFLTRPRVFNADKHPNLLVVEALLGVVMTEEQLQIVGDFVKDPSAIRRAITGAGKSSVILLLSGLLKANGKNLVTLKFLDPLLAENLQRIQSTLGGVFKRRVLPLIFTMQTPLVRKRKVDGKVEKESVFKSMYEKCLVTILEKGCVVTNRRSFPLLEAKLISMLYRFSNLPEGEKVEKIEWQHLEWLSKLVYLIRNHEEDLKDEHDKFLAPKEEIHLRLSGHIQNPQFVWNTILDIYDKLLEDKNLKLKENTQGEGPDSKREKAISHIANDLAASWQAKAKVSKSLTQAISNYFTGVNEEVLEHLEGKVTPSLLDELALTKDMLQMFLPIVLSKTANQKYILSKDQVNVIPADYALRPREGSEMEDIRERTAYMVQYYYQMGLSYEHFKSWLNDLMKEGLKEIDRGHKSQLSETDAEKRFQSYFPKESLSSLFAKDYERLQKEVNADPKLLRRFLEVLLPKLIISGKKITIDALNQVSASKASSGTSATRGCQEGFHAQFHPEVGDAKLIDASMLSRLMQRLHDKGLLRYDASRPEKIVSELLQKDPSLRVLIDGPGALWNIDGKEIATIMQQETREKAVGFFDAKGNLDVVGNPEATLSEKGQVYTHDQARGADVVLSQSKPAVLLANGRSPLEELMQNEGRLRKADQILRLAVPDESAIKTPEALLASHLKSGAVDNSDNILRSKKQEPRDYVRRNMLDNLLELLVKKKYDQAFSTFRRYEPENILVTVKSEDEWEKPGSYYKKNKHLQRKTKKPKEVLEKIHGDYLNIAVKQGLHKASDSIKSIDVSALLDKMPKSVFGTDAPLLDSQVEVETEQQVSVESEVSLDIAETEIAKTLDREDEVPFYLAWRDWKDRNYREHSYRDSLHPAYSNKLLFTENFLPLFRRSWTPPLYHRKAHDLKQNRLHFVEIRKVGNEYKLVALDLHDRSECHDVTYDVKLRRFVSSSHYSEVPPDCDLKTNKVSSDLLGLICQMRFENGEYTGYLPDEVAELEKWIGAQQDPSSLEKYFVDEVLKNRPEDRARYPFSPLREIFKRVG